MKYISVDCSSTPPLYIVIRYGAMRAMVCGVYTAVLQRRSFGLAPRCDYY